MHVRHKDVGVSGESESVLASTSWNASITAHTRGQHTVCTRSIVDSLSVMVTPNVTRSMPGKHDGVLVARLLQ